MADDATERLAQILGNNFAANKRRARIAIVLASVAIVLNLATLLSLWLTRFPIPWGQAISAILIGVAVVVISAFAIWGGKCLVQKGREYW